MPDLKLIKIDDSNRADHFYLDETDKCYFFGEYTARKWPSFSKTNQLIINLKKTMDKVSQIDWPYKEKAICECAELIRDSIEYNAKVTFIPVPPSKSKEDPLYDDRLVKILKLATESWTNPDIRELIIQTKSTDPTHLSYNGIPRPNPYMLQSIYSVDDNLLYPEPSGIVIFDDVLTTGCHYKAVKNKIRNYFKSVPIAGLFIARRRIERNGF